MKRLSSLFFLSLLISMNTSADERELAVPPYEVIEGQSCDSADFYGRNEVRVPIKYEDEREKVPKVGECDYSNLKDFGVYKDVDRLELWGYAKTVNLATLPKHLKIKSLELRGKMDHVEAVGEIKGLEYLTLTMLEGGKKISNFGDLDHLKYLSIDHKKEGDPKQLAGLARMKSLRLLNLDMNGLTEIPLSSPMKSLKSLYIGRVQSFDLSFLKFMPNLRKISLQDHVKYTRTEFLCSHKKLKSNPENADVFKRLCTRN